MGDVRRTWDLDTRTVTVAGAIVLSVKGRIGSAAAPAFADAIANAGRSSAAVVIDFGGVDYLSGAAIAALGEGAARNRECRIVLCGVSEPVRITLELSGALEAFTLAETRDDAVRRIQGVMDPKISG